MAPGIAQLRQHLLSRLGVPRRLTDIRNIVRWAPAARLTRGSNGRSSGAGRVRVRALRRTGAAAPARRRSSSCSYPPRRSRSGSTARPRAGTRGSCSRRARSALLDAQLPLAAVAGLNDVALRVQLETIAPRRRAVLGQRRAGGAAAAKPAVLLARLALLQPRPRVGSHRSFYAWPVASEA